MSISLQLPRYVATRVGYAFRDKNDRAITDPQTFYDGLAFVQTGHYALGVHGFFHGGIHIERASNNALSLKDNAIHCAADGEVVAYRIDRHYHDATPDAADGGRNLRPYSTGFVLVRHRLQAPMPPQAPKPATVENPMADRRNMGTFLYEDERGNNRLAWLPQGTPLLVELGADLPGKSSYVRVLNVMSPDVPKQGWINRVWLALDPMAGAGLRAVFGMKERVQTRVYGGDQPDPAKWDAYSRNQTELVKPAPPPAPALTLYSLYMHLGDLASYEKQTKRARPPWWPANDDAPRVPEATDRVVTLTQPVPIREGDLIGFIGEDVPARAYPIAGVPVSRLLLHLEMFSGDDVPTYLALSRRWASEHLPDSERTLLVLRKGETLHHQPDGAVACTLNRPLVLPLVGMEVTEVDGKRWRLVAKPSGGDVSAAGWVPEEGHLASPWQWPGFEVHDESFAEGGFRHEDAVAYARYLRKEAPRPPDSPFYRQLRSWLDANRDGDVSGEELQWALRNRSVAGMLGRLIVRHESEWSRAYMAANIATAQCIAEQLGPNSRKCVRDETPRAEKLPWWDEVAAGVAGFPQDSRVYFFHPGGVAGLFTRRKLTIEEARVRAFLRMIRVGEGTQGVAGYERLFGGSSFIKDHGRDFSDHPRIIIRRSGYSSSAAGAYQVMGYTWDDPGQAALRRRYGITDFEPFSQDRYGAILLKHKRSALPDIKAGRIREAILKCNSEWASLPGSPLGQPTVDWIKVISEFDSFLNEELNDQSDLSIAPGDIDDILN